MTTRWERGQKWDTDFAVATGLAGFDTFLALNDPELLKWNRGWVAAVRIAADRLADNDEMKEAA